MALTFQRYPVALRGLDTRTDDKQLLPGKLTALTNGAFNTPGELRKRQGLMSWPTQVVQSGSIGSGAGLAVHQDQAIVFSNSEAFGYVDSLSAWSRLGSVRSVSVHTDPVLRNGSVQRYPVMAASGGIELYAWCDEKGGELGVNEGYGVRYSVVDSRSRTVIIDDQPFFSQSITSGCPVTAFSFLGQLYLVAKSVGNGISYRRLDPANPTVLSPPVTLSTDVATSLGFTFTGPFNAAGPNAAVWDFCAIGDRLYMVHGTTGSFVANNGPRVKVTQFVSSSLTFLTSTLLSEDTRRTTYGPVACWTDTSNRLWWAAVSGTTSQQGDPFMFPPVYGGVLAQGSPTQLVTVMTESLLASPSTVGFGPRNLAGIWLTGSTSRLYLEMSGTGGGSGQDTYGPDATSIDRQLVSVHFGPQQASVTSSFLRGMALASRPFRHDGDHFLWTLFDSPEQPTYFCVSSSGSVVAKANPGLAGTSLRTHVLPEVVQTAAGVFRVPNGRRNGFFDDFRAPLLGRPSVTSTELDFNAVSASFQHVTMGRQLLIAGGVLRSFDRRSLSESGFHVYPEGLRFRTELSGGLITSGTYQYCAVYEATDNYSQVHRSRPSVPQDVVVESDEPVLSTGSIVVTVPTLRLTDRREVKVGLYRTTRSGEVFYKVTQFTGSIANDSAADVITYRDITGDEELVDNELLYTTGEVLENGEPVNARLITSWKGRAWLSGLDDPNELVYSKLPEEDRPVAFSDVLTYRLDPAGGPITAIVPMDECLVVFKRSTVLAVFPLTGDGTPYGSGPDNTGGGGGFADRLVASDVGCTNPNSVVATGMGVFFESANGIRLLKRDLEHAPVGYPVEAYNGLTITSACLVPGANEVRWTTLEGTCLCYDYSVDEWSTRTNHAAVDSAVLGDRFLVLSAAGAVRSEQSGSFTDDGAHVPLSFETGWLDFGTINGFKRVSRLFLLGERKGPHRLQVRIAYDYRDYSQTEVIDATTIDVDSPQYQHRVDLRQQLATAVRVEVTELPVSGSYGEGYSLSNLAFEVGTMAGGPRLAARRQT